MLTLMHEGLPVQKSNVKLEHQCVEDNKCQQTQSQCTCRLELTEFSDFVLLDLLDQIIDFLRLGRISGHGGWVPARQRLWHVEGDCFLCLLGCR